jgi:hypothetical protein
MPGHATACLFRTRKSAAARPARLIKRAQPRNFRPDFRPDERENLQTPRRVFQGNVRAFFPTLICTSAAMKTKANNGTRTRAFKRLCARRA